MPAQLDIHTASAIREMAHLLVESLPEYSRRPDLLLVVGAVLLLVYGQYLRIAHVEQRLFGQAIGSPKDEMASALLAGILGGVLATFLFVFVGVPLSGVGIWYIWLGALVLAVVHPRFFCFSYAGGLVSLSHLIFGVPNVHVSAVVALVAALHLVEAFLIAFAGARGATPVYVRSRAGRVVGGFLLQQFWPIPFVALVAGLVVPDMRGLGRSIAAPMWWPLIRPGLGEMVGFELAYGLLPVVAALGYSDFAIARRPQEKARHTAVLLVAYSLLLLSLAVLAQRTFLWALAAALFSPLGHEVVIALGRKRELMGEPVFVSERGVMVLDVLPGSPAARMGLRCGDLVRKFNDERIMGKADLAAAMYPWAIDAKVDVENVFTGTRRTLVCRGKVPPLGAVLAPEPGEPFFVDPYRSGGILRWLQARSAARRAGGRTF